MEVNLNFCGDRGESGWTCVRETELAGALSQFGTYDIFMVEVLLSPKNERTSLTTAGTWLAPLSIGSIYSSSITSTSANSSDQILLFYYRTSKEHIIASYIIVFHSQQSTTPHNPPAPSSSSSRHSTTAAALSRDASGRSARVHTLISPVLVVGSWLY